MDHTNLYSEQDIKNGKWMSVIAYLGLFWLIPFFLKRDNPYVRFHLNQGLPLLIISLVVNIVGEIVCALLTAILLSFVASLVGLLVDLIQIVIFVFMIIGIINVIHDRAKELPIIGFIRILK